MTTIEPLGRGLDHVAVLVGGDTVLRLALEDDPAARAERIRREAALLRRIAAVVPVAVPVPSRVAPEHGWLAHRLLPGAPLIDADPALRARRARETGAVLGRLMAALAGATEAVAAGAGAPLVQLDDTPPSEWLDEARDLHPRLGGAIPEPHRATVRAFLDAPAPPPPARHGLVLCHGDLGIEHVLVDGQGAVTGVIDWGDAAVADPAADLGRIHRDLGPEALDAALAALAPACPADVRERAVFLARCGALEDLAYGRDHGRAAYVGKVLAALPWLFPRSPRRAPARGPGGRSGSPPPG